MDTHREARLAAVAKDQHGAFSRDQAMSAGFSIETMEHRLAVGVWTVLGCHVYAASASPRTWRQRTMAAVLEARDGAVASHRSAGALLGVPGFGAGALEVLQLRGGHHRKTIARVHDTPWLPPGHVTVVDGIPCTTLARFIFDIAGTERPKRVARALDTALDRLGLPMAEMAQVVATMARRGRPGSTLVRELIEARGPGYVPPASELEALFDDVCLAFGVQPLEKQVWVGGEAPVGRVDFIDRHAKLLVECQSRAHHASWLDQQADMERRAELVAAGYRVLEVTYGQLVQEPDKVVRRLREARRNAA